VADQFLAAYASASGTAVQEYDPYWDAMALADTGFGEHPGSGTASLGPRGLTRAKIRSHLDTFAAAIVRRS
jgi:hypothetical protein